MKFVAVTFLLIFMLESTLGWKDAVVYRYPVYNNVLAYGSNGTYRQQSFETDEALLPKNYDIFSVTGEDNGNIRCENILDDCWESEYNNYYDIEQDIKKTPLISKTDDPCEEGNGGCLHKCENRNGWPLCLCDANFYPSFDGSCRTMEEDNNGVHYVLSDKSGTFEVSDWEMMCEVTWNIIAPKGHGIKVEFGAYNYQRPYTVIVTDGVKTRHQSTSVLTFFTTRNNVQLKVIRRNCHRTNRFQHNTEDRIKGSYSTGAVMIGNTEDSDPTIFTSFYAKPEVEFCLLLTYFMGNNFPTVNLVVINHYYSETSTMRKPLLEYNNGWRTDIFYSTKELDNSDYRLNVIFDENMRIFMARECSQTERYFIMNSERSEFSYTKTKQLEYCRNGGEEIQRGTCSCPIGFTGEQCEEACGPNKYGERCEKVCSAFSTECKGIYFCTNKKCSCAPGYGPPYCFRMCDPGKYGANCSQTCGYCKNDKCDPFTGKCLDGCETGYILPTCHYSYPHLKNPPKILEIKTGSVMFEETFEEIGGIGTAQFCEIQYKKKNDTKWSKMSPQKLEGRKTFHINGLLANTDYSLRIVLYTSERASNADKSPTVDIKTKCREPADFEIKLFPFDISDTSFGIEWTIAGAAADWCPILEYFVSLSTREEKVEFAVNSSETRLKFVNLQPSFEYSIQISLISNTGKKIMTPHLTVTTTTAAPGEVVNLKLNSSSANEAIISWNSPWNSINTNLTYKLAYQCMEFVSCEHADCLSSRGDIETNLSYTILKNLHPHAVYHIRVTAVSNTGREGTAKTIVIGTAEAGPTVAPSPAPQPVSAVWSNGATVWWSEPEDCTNLNGIMVGYNYQLLDSSGSQLLHQGSVAADVNHINLTTLEPDTKYQLVVTVVTSGGKGSVNLTIPVHTIGSFPDQIRHLVAYKKSRKTIGLRWEAPLHTYGQLKYFSISYHKVNSSEVTNVIVEPKKCSAWPNLYCNEIKGLKPTKYYSIKICARNSNVEADGDPATIEVFTKEEVATPPTNLQAINITADSLQLQWGPPDIFNGILRSFLIIVEKVNISASSEECCEPVLTEEYEVTSEEPEYNFEVKDLEPASRYSVAVSAKTMVLGIAEKLTIQTLPTDSLFYANTVASTSPETFTMQSE